MDNQTETAIVSQDHSITLSPVSNVNVEPPKPVYAFELVIQDWVDMLGAISEICDECKITVSAESMKVRTVDAAHIAMIETEIENRGSNYWPVGLLELPFDFGVDVEKMLEYLKGMTKAERQEVFTLKVETDKRRLVWEIDGIQYQSNLLDVEGFSDPHMPTLNLPGQFDVTDVKAFLKGIKKLQKVSDHIALELGGTTLKAITEGDMDKVSFDVMGVRSDNIGTPLRSVFPLDYLERIVKGLPVNQATIHMGTDYPIGLSSGRVRYLLAPRIESND